MRMRLFSQRQLPASACLCLAGLGMVLYLSGLAATLQLGDASVPGMLLVPALPMPLYMVMAVVVGAGVGITLLAALQQRRRRALEPQPEPEAAKSQWQTLLSTLGTLALGLVGLVWLMRHSTEVQRFLERWRFEMGLAQELLATHTRGAVQQIQSPTTGYTMFAMVMLVYGGLGALGLWILYESWGKPRLGGTVEAEHTRQVRRALVAGMQELRLHADPRQAIIACYAQLEHLLADHGVPAAASLTPQEYMGEALQTLSLPLEAFAELVHLFELARYSLHPLDNTTRSTALTCLERLHEALTQEPTYAVSA